MHWVSSAAVAHKIQMAYGADLTLNTFIAVTAINIQLLWYAFTMIPQMFDILSVLPVVTYIYLASFG